MEVFKDKYQRWGVISTILFHALLLLLFFLFGLKTPVPIPTENIIINFGTSADGSGTVQPEETAESPSPTEDLNTPTQPVTSSSPTQTEAVTQNNVDAPSVTDTKTEKVKEPEKEPEREVNQKALYPGKKSSSSQTSEGETGKAGDQGDPTGSRDATSHVGGNYGGDSYSLGSRKAIDKVKPQYDCPETGKVVVRIQVDRAGTVVNAKPGAKGTTNSAECLYRRALEAALKTKWESDPKAPEIQTGEIIYNYQFKQ